MNERITHFSPDRLYRYTLWREWDCDYSQIKEYYAHSKLCHYVQFIGLNPSTADETQDDPTIRRCIQFAKDWGYGALCMTNLFAWRDTDPAKMKQASEPIGQLNDEHLLAVARGASVVVAAWGLHGRHIYRAVKVKQLLAGEGIQLHCLRLTKGNHPEHPLYLPKTLLPIPLP